MKMNFMNMLSAAALVFAATQAHALISGDTKQFADRMGAANLTEVSFDQKGSALTDGEKKELANLVQDARQKGTIKEIKVLVWADREYPQNKESVAKSDVKLADARIKEIKKYMKDSLNVSDATFYNMAERPNKVEELFKTSDAKVKHAAEGTAAPTTSDQTGLFGWKGQSSKAVALVFMK